MTQLRKVIAPVASGSAQSTMSCTRLTQANWCQSAESNSNLTRSTCTGGHPFPQGMGGGERSSSFSAEEIKVLQSHIKDGESVTCAALIAQNAVLRSRNAGSVRKKLGALRKADPSTVSLPSHPSHYVCPPHTQ